MNTEQGQNIARALKAIAQLHSDTSRLLLDCDKYVGTGRPSVFGNYATRDLTYHVRAPWWMAEAVYRYYESDPQTADAVTVTFFSSSEEFEPLLLVGRIHYAKTSQGEVNALRQTCKEWDLWRLYFRSGVKQELGQVLEYNDMEEHRIAWARLLAVPLFSIHRIEDVCTLMSRVVESVPTCKVVNA
jgi:hypothetical protein